MLWQIYIREQGRRMYHAALGLCGGHPSNSTRDCRGFSLWSVRENVSETNKQNPRWAIYSTKKLSIDRSKAKLFAIIFSIIANWIMISSVEHDSPFSSCATSLVSLLERLNPSLVPTLLISILPLPGFGFSPSGTSMWYGVPKQDFSKCAEHITDEFVGVKFGRCSGTTRSNRFLMWT